MDNNIQNTFVDNIPDNNQDISQDNYYDYKNLCVECGVDMGSSNPRQYCGKTYCRNINYINNIENKDRK